MEASCGPTNALTSLSKHAQRDNSLQNEFIHRNAGNQPQRFRQGSQVDARLNNEFQQFNETNFVAPAFQQQQHQHQNQQHHNQQLHNQQHHNPAWVQDFSNLSLQQPKQGAIQNDWHKQFMQQHQPQQQYVQQHHQVSQPFGMNYTRGMHMNQAPHMAHETPQMEHPQVDFDSQFDMVEREMEGRMDDPTLDTEHDKAQFAETARQVESSLRAAESRLPEMSDKLQNSNFLKLMSSISNRQVELEGDKLVNADSKQDIREEISQHLSDPLADMKREMGSVSEDVPDHNYVSANYRRLDPITGSQDQSLAPPLCHLPDPLAHIKDGDLDGEEILLSLQAARIISGNQVKASDWIEDDDWLDMTEQPHIDAYKPRKNGLMSDAWQEVYDDYRHDDDFR